MAQNRYEEAIAILEPLQREELPLSHVHTVLGQAYLRRGLVAEAAAAFQKALERDDDNAEAHDGLGVTLRRQGRYEDAIYDHTRAVTLLHHRSQSHLNLGVALTMAEQYDWAIRALSIAAEMGPRNPAPHRWLTYIYRRAKKDAELARRHLAIAVDLRRSLQTAAKIDPAHAAGG